MEKDKKIESWRAELAKFRQEQEQQREKIADEMIRRAVKVALAAKVRDALAEDEGLTASAAAERRAVEWDAHVVLQQLGPCRWCEGVG